MREVLAGAARQGVRLASRPSRKKRVTRCARASRGPGSEGGRRGRRPARRGPSSPKVATPRKPRKGGMDHALRVQVLDKRGQRYSRNRVRCSVAVHTRATPRRSSARRTTLAIRRAVGRRPVHIVEHRRRRTVTAAAAAKPGPYGLEQDGIRRHGAADGLGRFSNGEARLRSGRRRTRSPAPGQEVRRDRRRAVGDVEGRASRNVDRGREVFVAPGRQDRSAVPDGHGEDISGQQGRDDPRLGPGATRKATHIRRNGGRNSPGQLEIAGPDNDV